eukprot:90640-Pelagomonas_calceolata.AAC.4
MAFCQARRTPHACAACREPLSQQRSKMPAAACNVCWSCVIACKVPFLVEYDKAVLPQPSPAAAGAATAAAAAAAAGPLRHSTTTQGQPAQAARVSPAAASRAGSAAPGGPAGSGGKPPSGAAAAATAAAGTRGLGTFPGYGNGANTTTTTTTTTFNNNSSSSAATPPSSSASSTPAPATSSLPLTSLSTAAAPTGAGVCRIVLKGAALGHSCKVNALRAVCLVMALRGVQQNENAGSGGRGEANLAAHANGGSSEGRADVCKVVGAEHAIECNCRGGRSKVSMAVCGNLGEGRANVGKVDLRSGECYAVWWAQLLPFRARLASTWRVAVLWNVMYAQNQWH